MSQLDESLLLDQECKRMLRRSSRIQIKNDVMYKLFSIEPIQSDTQTVSLYEAILIFFGCYKQNS